MAKSKIAFRLNYAEYESLYAMFQKSNCRNISEYVRQVCLQKPVVVNSRNQTAEEFLSATIEFKNQLDAVINAIPASNEEYKDALMQKVEEIRVFMKQIYQLWSHK